MCILLQIKRLTEEANYAEPVSEDEPIEEWSQDRLRKRSQELQLVDDNGQCIVPLVDRQPNDRNRHTTEDGTIVEIDDCSKSASTTSDSQITVRSSPIATKIDRLSVCRHCHKNCRQKLNQKRNTSLKVQHSQSSSSRCCQSANSSQAESPRSSSSRTSNNSKCKQPLANDDSSACSPMLSRSSRGSPSSTKTLTTTNSCSNNNNAPCKCRCTEHDFANIERQTQEVKRETCKLLNDVSELQAAKNKSLRYWPHANCDCSNGQIPIRESKICNMNEDTQLIGLSQFHPLTTLVHDDPFKAVPKISVVPPTPDGMGTTKKSSGNAAPWSTTDGGEFSPEDSPLDEELPYRALNTSLKRYGTMSSLEKLPSEETDEKTYDSSETDENDNDSNNGKSTVDRSAHQLFDYFLYVSSPTEIKIVTKEVYDANSRNWTHRAGTFLEQSRALIDTYLGRWDRGNLNSVDNDDDEDAMQDIGEECTSGEEVWGTPTSGENDEMQMFNSDQTHSVISILLFVC